MTGGSQTVPGNSVLQPAQFHASLGSTVAESMNFLNEVAQWYPDAISFAAGQPRDEFFDVDAVSRYLDVYRKHLAIANGWDEEKIRRTLMQYGRTKGIIHELIARHLAVDEGVVADPDTIVVTVGCQEALYLTLRCLCGSSRDALLVVRPCYTGAIGAAQLVDMPLLPVKDSVKGIDLDDLVDVVERAKADGLHPRALYVVPDFANPSGVSMTRETRESLLRIAAEHDFLILEDNPYGVFHGDSPPIPTLKALDRHHRVIYLGSFAKTGMPGARVGYVVADQPVRADDLRRQGRLADWIANAKGMLTINTSPLAQAVIGGKLLENNYSLRVANAAERQFYQRNLKTLLGGLSSRFGPEVSWNTPSGGLFLVLTLPFPVTDELLEYSARKHGVIWVPMHYFYADGVVRNQIRLSFSNVTPVEIETGLDRLAEFVRDRAAV